MNKWLIDARTFGSAPTGVGVYAYRLVKRMLSNAAEGLQVVLVCDVEGSEELADLKRAGCEVRAYGRRVYNSVGVIGYFRFVRRVVREVRPEVFWQPNNLQPFRVRGVRRVIVTMHDVFGLGWSWRYALWHLYYRFNFRRTLGNVTEVWYNSEQTRREVHAKAGGVEALAFGGRRLTERVTHPIAEVPERESVEAYRHSRPYFLYFGNVEMRKGADLLFAAFREYRQTAEGPGDLIVAGKERNVQVPADAGIVRLGYVDEKTKWSLLKGCVALVAPSRAEGYGMQVAEALAFGTPVIASDLAVFKEVESEVSSNCRAPHPRAISYLPDFQSSPTAQRIASLSTALHSFMRRC